MKVGGPGEKAVKDRSARNSGSYSSYSSSQYSNDNQHSYPNTSRCGNTSPITIQTSPSPADHHPTPVFLGIQDRIASKLLDAKLQAEDIGGFEMDDDGPLREEYLPRRRSREVIAPAYHAPQGSSAYGTPSGHVYTAQAGRGQTYGSIPHPADANPSIHRQSLAQLPLDAHSQAVPAAHNINDGAFNDPALKAAYAPSTTSLFAFPNPSPNHDTSAARYPSLQALGFGLDSFDNMYAASGAGLGLPLNSNYLTHGIGHPRVASTLCDYFLSYSRVRVY